MFRPCLCTKSVYKINESPNIYLEKTEQGSNSVLRQSLVRKRCWRGKHAKKLENLDFKSSYILKRNNSLPSLRESNENSRIVPGISFERPSFSDRNPFTNRKSICFSATGFSQTGYSANYVIQDTQQDSFRPIQSTSNEQFQMSLFLHIKLFLHKLYPGGWFMSFL